MIKDKSVITIRRHYFTRDICQGTMTIDGMPGTRLLTLESSLPRDLRSYVGHALPPGDYPCVCEEVPVTYKGVTVHVPWISILPVKWFPGARVVCGACQGPPPRGVISIGTERTDNGFALVSHDDETLKLWVRLAKAVRDSGGEMTLRIVNADDIVFEDTYRDKAALEALEREEAARREAAVRELLGEFKN